MSDHLSVADRARLAILRVDRSAVFGLAVLGAIAVVVAVVLAMHGRPHEIRVVGDGSAVASSGQNTARSSDSATAGVDAKSVVVDVVGRVRHPGLVTVPAGSRVADVIKAAGGLSRRTDASSVNQARVVMDGEQVVVGVGGGTAGAAGAPSAGGSGGAADATAPVDLNTASLDQLESLPGVGPVLAQRILDRRTTVGPFGSVDELRDVSGIGDKTFADIAPHVRV